MAAASGWVASSAAVRAYVISCSFSGSLRIGDPLALVAELFGERVPGTVETALDGADRQPQLPGYLLHRQLSDVVEDQHLAVARAQPSQGVVQVEAVGGGAGTSAGGPWRARAASHRRARRLLL